MSPALRNNVRVFGSGERVMMFAHGYGCDQTMWRYVVPHFQDRFRIVLFDHVGAGASHIFAYSPTKYGTLDGYAQDLVEIAEDLDLSDVILVGHSVSAMIGALASIKAPTRFGKLVMVGPSPRYIDDDAYRGGFSQMQIAELLDFLSINYQGWAVATAPVIMGNPDRPELGIELTDSFCRADPDIAKDFARVTFMSDNREDLPRVAVPTLVLQCSEDIIAPIEVGEYVRDHIPNSQFVLLEATGHCPNLSAPDEVVRAIRAFV
ncbi:alpha/beta hydrolase (plasmid) [Bosea sp. Tri-49]|nr:alpha/beta hydrolase [Bosea sp. Tri-49]